jgi:hypothetical protein
MIEVLSTNLWLLASMPLGLPFSDAIFPLAQPLRLLPAAMRRMQFRRFS